MYSVRTLAFDGVTVLVYIAKPVMCLSTVQCTTPSGGGGGRVNGLMLVVSERLTGGYGDCTKVIEIIDHDYVICDSVTRLKNELDRTVVLLQTFIVTVMRIRICSDHT